MAVYEIVAGPGPLPLDGEIESQVTSFEAVQLPEQPAGEPQTVIVPEPPPYAAVALVGLIVYAHPFSPA